jgi:hypothetical protein
MNGVDPAQWNTPRDLPAAFTKMRRHEEVVNHSFGSNIPVAVFFLTASHVKC